MAQRVEVFLLHLHAAQAQERTEPRSSGKSFGKYLSTISLNYYGQILYATLQQPLIWVNPASGARREREQSVNYLNMGWDSVRAAGRKHISNMWARTCDKGGPFFCRAFYSVAY